MDGFIVRRWNGLPFLLVLAISVAVTFSGIRLKAQSAAGSSAQPITGELTVSSNPNYFKDANGAALILNGSQTWNTSSGLGHRRVGPGLGFRRFRQLPHRARAQFYFAVDASEMPKFCGLPTTASASSGFHGQPASVDEDRPRERNRRRIEIRSHEIRPELFRPLADAGAGPE